MKLQVNFLFVSDGPIYLFIFVFYLLIYLAIHSPHTVVHQNDKSGRQVVPHSLSEWGKISFQWFRIDGELGLSPFTGCETIPKQDPSPISRTLYRQTIVTRACTTNLTRDKRIHQGIWARTGEGPKAISGNVVKERIAFGRKNQVQEIFFRTFVLRFVHGLILYLLFLYLCSLSS